MTPEETAVARQLCVLPGFPKFATLVRCHGSGWLTVEIWCFGCEDCGPVEMGEDVADVPGWPS